jgi:hypothetical protein
MRRPIAAMLPLVILTTALARGEQTFPYKAYVAADDVYVRSGPGKNYYPTSKLSAGDVVEVYRHDPGGWYAIRPPKGSFTWISSRFLKPSGDGLAEVASANVSARVGSEFSDIRDVIQVRLHQGELVEPLEAPAAAAADGQTWTKISPPSGEFRWVYGKLVDPDYAADGARKVAENTSPLVSSAPASDVEPARPPGAREAARPIPRDGDGRRQNPAKSPPAASSPGSRTLSADEFQKRLEDADMELSIMVAEEPTVWTFDALVLEAELLMAQAETAVERGRARLLLNKIDRFAGIRQRYDAVNGMLADTDRRNEQLASLRRDAAEPSTPSDRFDGRGRLTRVVSPKQGAPRYALVDESGKVRCYVSPAPGVNLRHYEQRWVGVNGVRGYMPEQQAAHVMAKHISVLESPTLR